MTIALAGDDDKVDFPLYLLALGAITKTQKKRRKGFSNWQQLRELPANRIASFLCKEYRKLSAWQRGKQGKYLIDWQKAWLFLWVI